MYVLALALALAGSPLDQHQCGRCHEGPGLAPVADAAHCVRCHRQILAGTYEVAPETLRRWRSELVNLPVAPSLFGAARLTRAAIVDLLVRPHDLRPNLGATMPRLPLDREAAEAIAAALTGPDEAASGAGKEERIHASQVEAGRRAYVARGCPGCHVFSGAGVPGPAVVGVAPDPIALAPDLRFARARMRADRLADWIADPRAIKPDATMAAFPGDRAEVEAIAAFLLRAELAEVTAARPTRLPRLTRRVGFEEVERRVFKKICWHCHSAADLAGGDGGPGNTGGFGFPGRGLDLSSYTAIASGSLDDRGERQSVFRPGPDGEPLLVSVLLARRAEEAGAIPELRGMPLGFPSMTPEEIQLVESWVAQGRPR